MRIVSDVHGKRKEYLKIIKNCDYSVQLGDLDFDYDFLNKVDHTKHINLFGNHDNYDVKPPEHNLGDYGMVNHGLPFYFVRGAWSIDWSWRKEHERRTGQRVWWEQEELDYRGLELAIREYSALRPDLVITHCCPQSLVAGLTDPEFAVQFGYDGEIQTRTGLALQSMFEAWQPKLWIHGHYHKFDDKVVNGTRFVSLNQCAERHWWCDVDENLEVYYK